MKQQAIDAHRPDVKFAFTEWLMIATHSHSVPNYNNMGGALFAGGFLNAMIRNSDVVSIANMTGILVTKSSLGGPGVSLGVLSTL